MYANSAINYPNANNYTNSANSNYASKLLTNCTIYANKPLAIPTMLTISMILSILILATLTKKKIIIR